jgi:hypothetical protein
VACSAAGPAKSTCPAVQKPGGIGMSHAVPTNIAWGYTIVAETRVFLPICPKRVAEFREYFAESVIRLHLCSKLTYIPPILMPS